MSQDSDQLWMLNAVSSLSSERIDQWARLCYQPSPVDQLLADPSRSIIVLTTPGCGMSTSLALLPRSGILTLDYPPERWPGVEQAFTRAENHFGQWMGLLAQHLRDRLSEQPDQVGLLNVQHHEFLAWIIRKYLSPRQGAIWLSQMSEQLRPADWASVQATIESGELDESYTDTGSGLTGQIEESVQIARRLGYSGIFATIDVSWAEWLRRNPEQRTALATSVRQLLSTLIVLQRRGFGIKVSLPAVLGLGVAEVEQLVRGRATIATYEWDEAALAQLTRRLTGAASAGAVSAEPWLDSATWAIIGTDLTQIWGGPGPAAAAALARAIIDHGSLSIVTPDALQQLRRSLYQRHAPIQLDPDLGRRTIWRGRQPITFGEAPFSCLAILWAERGRVVETSRLRQHMGSQANLDKNVSRIRQQIEPFFKEGDYLYLQREQSRGIWLDHYADSAVPALNKARFA
ncbi:hypothetical protein EKD04_015700 [Chloroflexales bacterium ZM16-3]|nr:hypothetical protein [Chloroflexales bacterium ZM16-3]